MMWDDVFNSLWDEIMKERMNKDMKLEYKFYEKNLAPKWLEGDYDLHIEGNRMTMTSNDGKKVEARCHPDDDWRLQVGIDELKERMAEAKKPREIKVGDIVKVKTSQQCNTMDATSFFKENNIPVEHIVCAVQASSGMGCPSIYNKYQVLYVGNLSAKGGKKCALIKNNITTREYVVDYDNLELVE
nr:MAG TPA: hypothetical protein [Caudoviricetes sp.]